VGLFSYAENTHVEAVRLVYKTSQGQAEVSMRMLSRDARALKNRVGALLSNGSDQPVRLERERLLDGSCFTRWQQD
jgi:hypothetical protein